MDIEHQSRGRTARSISALVFSGGILLIAFLLGAPVWLLPVLAIFALPTLVDVLFDPVATFGLNADELRWKSSTQEAQIRLDQILSARMDTRLGVAFRTTLTMENGSNVRIPNDVLPPQKKLESAFKAHGVPLNRNRLTLI